LRLRSFQSEIFVSGLRAHRIVGNIGGPVKEVLRVVNVEITLNVQKLKIDEPAHAQKNYPTKMRNKKGAPQGRPCDSR
jgi:hypothetical protein